MVASLEFSRTSNLRFVLQLSDGLKFLELLISRSSMIESLGIMQRSDGNISTFGGPRRVG